ncbi:MAG: patatin-like phospholipase family protein [Clostridia bacterium]|nr:patatin-like phospholipase family protein [Clostridia bacterium]
MRLLEKIKTNLTLKKHKKIKIGLALGGGGARGYAHLGAIKAFEEYGLKFDFIAGTSAGSLVGAFYASGWSYNQIYEIAKEFKKKDIRRNKIPFMTSSTEGIQEIIKNNLGDIDVSDTKIPFCAVAVDVLSTQECIITKGEMAKAVAGSCAVPGIFQPVEFEGRALADGGLQNTLPSNVPKLFGCDYVIAVDVNAKRTYGAGSTKLLDVMGATIRILMKRNAEKGYEYADVVLKPETKRFKSTSLEGFDDMIEEGYLETIDQMPKILEIFNKKPISKKIKASYKDEAVII